MIDSREEAEDIMPSPSQTARSSPCQYNKDGQQLRFCGDRHAYSRPQARLNRPNFRAREQGSNQEVHQGL